MNFCYQIKRGICALALAASLFVSSCHSEESQSKQIQPPKPEKLEQRLSNEIAEQNCLPDKYAVLICGSDEDRFLLNLTMAYQVLLESGFKKENVYILDQYGEQKFLYSADDVATRCSIDKLFSHLEKKVDSEDLLMIYITDHGQRREFGLENSFTEVGLPFENINEVEISNYLSKIKPKVGILLTDICFGGGIAKRIGKGNYIGISASKENEEGYALVGDSFGMFFYLAFRDSKKSDINQDGKVTLDEAFIYAVLNHSWSYSGAQTPQIFSEIDVSKVTIK